jgi:dipeptidyl aminopeptidase/acylaminoacyl peptidase
MTSAGSRNRIIGFAILAIVCLAAGVGYLLYARDRSTAQERDAKRVAVTGGSKLDEFVAEPHMLFRSTAYGDTYGKVAVVPIDDSNGPRAVTPLSCERVDMAASRGICLVANRGVITTYGGLVFDEKFRVTQRFDLPGLPSRARVAPDGSFAAMTVFVSGDSYAGGAFSTRTIFADLETGELIGHLEEFDVTKDGSVVDSIDRNYWGVTFAPDSDTFYATLQTGGQIYLIKGKLSDGSAKVVDEGIECPSLSPDGTRIAYKKRIGDVLDVQWRLHVRDLATGDDVELTETRSVDDQVEWFDDATVLFGLPKSQSGTAETNTWTVPADGSGKPELLVPRAWSPSVLRNS